MTQIIPLGIAALALVLAVALAARLHYLGRHLRDVKRDTDAMRQQLRETRRALIAANAALADYRTATDQAITDHLSCNGDPS